MNKIINIKGSLELGSEHSIGKAIVYNIQNKYPNIKLSTPNEIETIPGLGISGEVKNNKIIAGNIEYLKSLNIFVPHEVWKKRKLI